MPASAADVWAVDTAIAVDMVRVFALVAGCQHYPDTLSYGTRFGGIARAWRPARVEGGQRQVETL
jgi:hypothetical protein